MLRLEVGRKEMFDELKQEFYMSEGHVLEFEHSLFSLSKWESKFEKSFLSSDDKTPEEIIEYIKMMTLTHDVDDSVYDLLTQDDGKKISDYIQSDQTATTIREGRRSASREIVTAEIIYYWMISAQIDWQAQYWHLNRLLMLIRVCSEKNKKPNKMSRKDAMAQQRSLNAQRQAQFGTKG